MFSQSRPITIQGNKRSRNQGHKGLRPFHFKEKQQQQQQSWNAMFLDFLKQEFGFIQVPERLTVPCFFNSHLFTSKSK